ncbi:ATP-dependent nuclease [Allochromatium vinosum]|uniref:AAA ATPase n=1 Tax=Allochromatium vinosum (strain ATCC 17899 / DSM 180 / NBRC 103801 / NCIMB 10441 / D) TaxID=572477 RepID=D3RUD6_ALLVD|nr:AAA family ATPase [Allochromatium vinosum]ADC62795.1 AAA ATPase [Allochromatium vinosum DSM 180]
MHRLSHIRIKNFRACKDVSLPLESYTPLVGQNNTGKSSILQALSWVLKPAALSVKDFHDPGQMVEVIACIDGITNEVLGRIPEEKHRKAITPYCRDGRLWIRASATGAITKKLIKEVWDVEQCQEDGEPGHWRDYPTGLPQAVSALLPEPLLVQAMHDIGEDLGKAKAGTTIKSLLDEIMGPLLEAHAELNTALDTIRNVLTAEGDHRSDHLQQFDADASGALEHFFPGLSLDLDLQVVDVKEFFKAGDLHVTDKTTGDRRRFDQMGAGAQRAIQMALIRYLAGMRRGEGGSPSRRLLLIDEPELYLHPQGVRRLRQALASLAQTGFQVVFSTHSPLMLSRDNAADTVIVRKSANEGVTVRKPLRQAVNEAIEGAESQSRAFFELSNLAEIYFAERIVLCEGKTDRRLLPLAYERLYGHAPELDHIAFVSLGSCADIPKALLVLAAMGIRACAVADLDFAYTHARKGGLLDRNAQDMADTRRILAHLQPDHGFTLNNNGLPQSDNQAGWRAADIWACFASDEEGKTIAEGSHDAMKKVGVWVWPQGCIEQVTGADDKGEDSIIVQEEQLRDMSAAKIEQQMPTFKACFDWIRSM